MSDDKGAVEEIMDSLYEQLPSYCLSPAENHLAHRATVERVVGEKDAEIAELHARIEAMVAGMREVWLDIDRAMAVLETEEDLPTELQ